MTERKGSGNVDPAKRDQMIREGVKVYNDFVNKPLLDPTGIPDRTKSIPVAPPVIRKPRRRS